MRLSKVLLEIEKKSPILPEKKLKATQLHGLHIDNRAKMVPYAGWHMPMQYEGMAIEHLHTRSKCSLFDVSHMGQVHFLGNDREKFVQWITPVDFSRMQAMQGRLTVLMNDHAGVIDDLIVQRREGRVSAVLNASRFSADMAHIAEKLSEFGGDVQMEIDGSRSLLALQGPMSALVLERHVSGVTDLPYMSCMDSTIRGCPVTVSRSGYTGEDGFELSVKHADAENVARILLNEPEVKHAGLGARNSLRVEAGFCLYGKELEENISIAEAGLTWLALPRRRKEGGFVGHEALMAELADPTLKPMRRVGILSTGLCARDGAEIYSMDDKEAGYVTSGCPSPTLKCNVAQAYVHVDYTQPGTKLKLIAKQGRPAIIGEVTKMPFVPTRRTLAQIADAEKRSGSS